MAASFMKKLLAATALCLAASGTLRSDLQVNPQMIRVAIPSGKAYSGEYIIKNPSSDTVSFSVASENWLKLRGINSENSGIDVAEWFTLTPREFTLDPGETRAIDYSIKLPSGLNGEVVAMNFFAVQNIDISGGGVSVQRRFGFPVYAAADEGLNMSCNVTDIKISNASMSLRIENDGNAHIRPEVHVFISGSGDSSAAKIELVGRTPIFPGQIEKFSARQAVLNELDLPSGRYIAQPLIKYGMDYDREYSVKGDSTEFMVK